MTLQFIFLAGDGGFSLITPDWGLVAWTSIIFLMLLFLLSKFAFKPIMGALKNREDSISDALASAEKARSEMANLQSDNEKLIKEAREEKNRILQEAREIRDREIADAKNKAKEEADKILLNARAEIEVEKNAAMASVKNDVGKMAVEIAEKILGKQLDNRSEQEKLADSYLGDIKLS